MLMLNLTLLLMLQAPVRVPPSPPPPLYPATGTSQCQSYMDGRLVTSQCGKELKNLSSGQHRVLVRTLGGALGINYRCNGPSGVQVQAASYAITLDVRELDNGIWVSRAVGEVQWDAKGVIVKSSLPKIGGGCASVDGFTTWPAPPRVGPGYYFDYPPASHGRTG